MGIDRFDILFLASTERQVDVPPKIAILKGMRVFL